MSAAPSPPDDDRPTEGRGVARLAEAMTAFLAAGDLTDADARADFLARHEPLRDLLEPLLDEEPDDEPDGDARPALAPGQLVGDYRVVREVGQGGMGAVYEAQQLSLGRRVALKVLHPQLTMHATSIERFRREAAAAAKLRHPGIVPIHEVGEWRGLHFFSMEFVDGRPLKQLLHEEHLGLGDRRDAARERAELVARVADALQHAHEHHLIHRDVKPQNIMVGDDGAVWLLDFGLVKNLTEPSHSVTAGFFGTPHYCSPEQVQPDAVVGPATDVFSLGIVLYELLARRRPFDGESSRAVMDRIRAGDFASLRAAAPSTPRDLATICHKALEAEPSRRYPTARAFADDLRRFLRGEPIEARPPGVVARAWKWSRRNRSRLVLWSAAAVLVLGAPLAYALHQRETARAIERERRALGDAEQVGFRSIEQTLAMLADLLHRLPGPPERSREQVDQVVRECEAFLQLRAQDAGRRRRVAHALHRTSYVYSALGDIERALSSCRRGAEVIADVPNGADAADDALRAQLRRRAACLRQRLHAETEDEEFAALLAAHRNEPSPTRAATNEFAMTLLARSRELAQDPARSEDVPQLLRAALSLLPADADAEATDEVAALLRLRCRIDLGVWLSRQRRFDEALRELEPTLNELDALPGAPTVALARVRARLAIEEARRLSGQRTGSTDELAATIELAERLLEEYPGNSALRRTLARSQLYLSSSLLARGHVAAAERVARRIHARHHDDSETWADGVFDARVAMQLASCAAMGGDDARRDEARALARSACERFDRALADHRDRLEQSADIAVDMAGALSNVAAIENRDGNHDDAAQFARRAVDIQRRVLQCWPQHDRARAFFAIHHSQLAYALARLDNPAGVADAADTTLRFGERDFASLRLAAQAAALVAAPDEVGARCADVAVQLLRRLVALDRKKARELLSSAVFRSLYDRDDFAALRAEAER